MAASLPPSRTIGISAELYDYVVGHASPGTDPIARALAEATAERYPDLAGMNIGEDEGRLLMWLVQLSGARTVVEVGTFTGMSALWLARGLPEGGTLTCFDVSAEYPEVGRPHWQRAGVAGCIDVRIGPAAEGLARLPETPHVDLAFVDADKPGYATYLDLLLPRLSPGGFIAVDNTLWKGLVVDPSDQSENTRAIREFNDAVATRDDLDVVVLTIGDGLTLIRPRR